jgi:hypothetical protein
MKLIAILLVFFSLHAKEKLRFFNLDLHVSVIADVKNIFESLGHEVVTWSLSGHTWIFGKERDSVEIVNENTWGQLDPEMCDRFYERYKDFLSQFDGFIVTHTPSFSLLYAKCNKPIIIVNSTRYESPFSNSPEKWAWLNKYLKEGVAKGQIFIVSNNKGDQQYLKQHTGIESEHIPSLCLYTNASYSGVQDGFIFHPLGEKQFKSTLKKSLGRLWSRVKNKKLPPRYSWETLYAHKAIVHFPYQVSTMSLFEQYSANVPLFLPSKSFLLSLQKQYPNFILSQLSFFSLGQFKMPTEPGNLNNLNDPNVIASWIDLADYYDAENMPYIQTFDSFKQLKKMLAKSDFKKISEQMKAHNQKRQSAAIQKWKGILQRIARTYSKKDF